MTTLAVLHALRAKLLKRGWFAKGDKCLIMMLDSVVRGEHWKSAGRPAWEAVRVTLGASSVVAWYYNSDLELHDVVYVIDRTIERIDCGVERIN